MENTEAKQEISFRDRLSIVGEQGERLWVYSKKPKGPLYNARMLVGYLLAAFFFLAPLIKVNGEQFFLFDILNRRFIIFGAIFWPQDSYIFFLSFISMLIFTILFTVVYGRMWCGWACPQTVFTELFYRKIEYLIEGDSAQQKQLKNQKWDLDKMSKKFLKHSIFWFFAFIISNTLLCYIIGFDKVVQIAGDNISEHKQGFVVIFIFTTVLYLIYGKLRELACIIVCPYGRLQSVLLDTNSIVVAYDYKRGEPRREPKSETKGTTEAQSQGDCIDCRNCVMVCPTNIDIRNGTQLECVNCTACIDACNQVMVRVKKPKGLVRFASSRQIAEGKKFEFTPRIMFYTAILVGLLSFLSYLLITRTDVETTILRTQGTLYQEQTDNRISNLYNIKVLNKTHNDLPITVKLVSQEGEIQMVGGTLNVKKELAAETVFLVFINKSNLTSEKTPIKFAVYSGDRLIEEINSTFEAPIKK